MTGFYRRYETAWNRAGYSLTPQYRGQAKLTHDFAESVIAIRLGGIVGKTPDGRWVGLTPIDASLAA